MIASVTVNTEKYKLNWDITWEGNKFSIVHYNSGEQVTLDDMKLNDVANVKEILEIKAKVREIVNG